jgi:hypothetical protein
MTAFNGTMTDSPLGLDLFGSIGLSGFTVPAAFGGVRAATDAQSGPRTVVTPAAMLGLALNGTYQGEFGDELFNKIIVTPPLVALGFVLSANVFNVSVWNTFLAQAKILTSIQITGSGNLIVAPPASLPLLFGAFQALTFVCTIPQDGDATIQNVATWQFTPGLAGASLLVTGIRITLFTPDPDWQNDFIEDTEFLTTIMRSYGDNEQRYALRKYPRTAVSYLVRATSQREANTLKALLWGWQTRLFGVPFWPDAQRLSVQLNSGGSVITVPSTANTKFAVGGICMIWRDWNTSAALSIQGVSATTITLSAPVTSTWLADGKTFVVPVLSGRMKDSVDETDTSGTLNELQVDFECEVV